VLEKDFVFSLLSKVNGKNNEVTEAGHENRLILLSKEM
jgi:hypothetical protein